MRLSAALLALAISGCASAPPPSPSEPGAPAVDAPPQPAGQGARAPTPAAQASPSAPPAGSAAAAPAGAGPACAKAVGECGYARCDEKAGRCLFPCGSDADCVEGARCQPSPGNGAIATCQMPLPFSGGAP